MAEHTDTLPRATLFAPGNVAVITGAASGIGRACAQRFARSGMRLALFDQDETALKQLAAGLNAEVRCLAGDVSRKEDVERLRETAFDAFGAVNVLMNNAAISGAGSDNWTGLDTWRRILEVNLWGVINGVHAFAASMLAQGSRGAIINTGSKQGITNPPGYPAYAVAKAGVKTLTEQLAHGLRQEGKQVTAHLLVPGWTFTGMTRTSGGERPAGAWAPEQVVEHMVGAVEAGDFYVICPDNVVSSRLDAVRMLWSAQDITENRPALSRWHPDWQSQFEVFVRKQLGD